MPETNTTLQVVALQVPTTIKSLVEALIFGAREPLTVREIQAMYEAQAGEGGEPRKIDYEEIARIVEDLNSDYTASDRPYRIVQIAGGYQFATLPAYAEWLGRLYKEQSRRKLSQSSIETLAIIAYKQPITKPELESIRGVNCDYVIKTLLEKDLATIVGRASTVGRPLLYGTSREFLRHFGLNNLNDLPKPREIQEILGESQFETERRMLEAQQGLQEKKEEEFKSRLPHIPKRKAGLDDDVKIVPRRYTREIKVRPAEPAEGASPEEVKEGAPLNVTPDALPALPVEDLAQNTGNSAAALGDIPIVEKEVESEAPIIEDEAADAVEAQAPPAQPRYLDLVPPSGEVTDLEGRQDHIEVSSSEGISPEDLDSQIAAPDASIEPAVQRTFPEAPDIECAHDEPHATDLTGVPEVISAKEESFEEQVSPDEVATVGPPEDRIPQPDSPIIEEDFESAEHSELREPNEQVPDQHVSPQPKTRWKSWKEKIQGFIKKLFG